MPSSLSKSSFWDVIYSNTASTHFLVGLTFILFEDFLKMFFVLFLSPDLIYRPSDYPITPLFVDKTEITVKHQVPVFWFVVWKHFLIIDFVSDVPQVSLVFYIKLQTI